MKNNFAVVAVGVLLLGVAFYGISRPIVVNVSQPLGAAAGSVITEPRQFLNSVFLSRESNQTASLPGVTTSTLGGTSSTVTSAVICKNTVVDVTLPATGQNITLPSSSAMFDSGSGCLTQNGDVRRFFFQNASGAGNFTLVISDQSSTLKLLTVATSSLAGVNGTSSLNFGDIASVTAVRTVSSTSVWLRWLVEVLR